jgi:hypothetical protein
MILFRFFIALFLNPKVKMNIKQNRQFKVDKGLLNQFKFNPVLHKGGCAFSTSNFNLNVNKNVKDDNLSLSGENINSFNLGLSDIIKEITSNPLYIKITEILNSNTDNRVKQIQIEKILRFF